MTTRGATALALAVALCAASGCLGNFGGDGTPYGGPVAPPRAIATQLRGTVVDAVTLAPLAGAKVAIDLQEYTTPVDGTYHLTNLRMTAATLVTTRAGYDTLRTLLPLPGGDVTHQVRLSPNPAIP